MKRSRRQFLQAVMIMSSGSVGRVASGASGRSGLKAEAVEAFRGAVREAVAARVVSGAAWWLERSGEAVHGAEGWAVRVPEVDKTAASEATIFDAASLTKVMVTTPCVMRLVEEGKVDLEERVSRYLPEFSGKGCDAIRVRHLLAHTSGLKPGLSRQEPWRGKQAALKLAFAAEPTHRPEEVFRYSDINFILLGVLVEAASGMPLDSYAQQMVFEPLGMNDTGFAPDAGLRGRVAATERDETGQMLRGVVHDPTARRMGGVAGHAGLFTTAADVARYARSLLRGGELDGRRFLQTETVRRMTAVATPATLAEKRTLGWDLDTTYSRPRGGFPAGNSYGHTGFTGCCLWIDPASQAFFVLLSNRLHETDPGTDSRELYAALGSHAAEAAGYSRVSNKRPQSGL